MCKNCRYCGTFEVSSGAHTYTAENCYNAGDFDGITISGDYTLDVTGRYMRSGDAIVEDTIV